MIAWIATVISLYGILLSAKKNYWCWIVWLVGDSLWTVTAVTRNQVYLPDIVTWTGFFLANIYGFVLWRKNGTD